MAKYVKTEQGYINITELPYMDKVNPTGTGAFSLNRKAYTTIGNYSFAEGRDTTVSGYASHAEGFYTTASGECSHAEGHNTTASGNYSHAEGYYTKASSQYQHVHGKYNIKDTSNTYTEIVGNGDATKSSNAHTLDWSGNAWYAGDVYVRSTSGTDKDEGSKKLATEEYVDTAKTEAQQLGLTAATPGQIIKVKAVQDGKPTEWEAVDMPGGGVEWYEVIDMETAENVNDLIISTDKNGRPISGYHALAMVLCFKIPADSTQTSNNGKIWVYPIGSNNLTSVLRIISDDAGWKTIDRTYNYLYAGSNRAIFVSGANAASVFNETINNVFDGVRLFISTAGDHLPAGTKVRCLVLSKGWMA